MTFSDDFLKSLNNWQKGWKEDQTARTILANDLSQQCKDLPSKYKIVNGTCFRKRFIHKGELTPIIMENYKDEGVASWTTDERYAERFKGLLKENAVTGAIFKITPKPEDVIVNIIKLWEDPIFVSAVQNYSRRNPDNTKALCHFKADQSEVILKSCLRGSDIIALTGLASPFDILCDQVGIADEIRDNIYKKLIEQGNYVEEPRYTPPGGAQAALKRTIEILNKRILELSHATPNIAQISKSVDKSI